MDLIERRNHATRRHPWETSRLAALRALIQTLPIEAQDAVLDLGCGDGFLLHGLFGGSPRGGTLVGIDKHFTDEELVAAREHYPGIRFARQLEPGLPQVFPLVLLLDVLEHIEDDVGCLRDLVNNHLAPAGHAVVTAPAFQRLYCEHDRALRHVRRYDPGELRRVARDAGLVVERHGHMFGSLLPVRLLLVAVERVLGPRIKRHVGVSGWNCGKLTTWVTDFALRADNRFLLTASARGWDVPGLTEWMICRKS